MFPNCGGFFDIDNKQNRLGQLEQEMSQPDFWNREDKQKVVAEVKKHKAWLGPWEKLLKEVQDTDEMIELSAETTETEFFADIRKGLEHITSGINTLELRRKLGGEHDALDAIVSINAGAGGTESCDWAEMLLRMYTRWTEEHGYKVSIIDILAGEEAGIKNVTLTVRGDCAYGYLQSERGVHRLVRISPFDSNKRRHTSFASVDVIPEVDDSIEVDVEDKDLRIDTYRAGGRGGQHVNVTDSAVRITHLPTNIVAQCQNERSQHQNKAMAMKILKARLYEYYWRQQEEKLKKQYGDKAQIAWGSQIRSYVLHPYNMVKDHRTECQTSNTTAVLNGDIDQFIESYLRTMT